MPKPAHQQPLPILYVDLRYVGIPAERAARALQLIATSVAVLEGTALVVETREHERDHVPGAG